MFEFNEEGMKDLTDAYNLLNQLEVKGIQNSNILANVANLLQRFFSNIKEMEKGISIDNTKEDENNE